MSRLDTTGRVAILPCGGHMKFTSKTILETVTQQMMTKNLDDTTHVNPITWEQDGFDTHSTFKIELKELLAKDNELDECNIDKCIQIFLDPKSWSRNSKRRITDYEPISPIEKDDIVSPSGKLFDKAEFAFLDNICSNKSAVERMYNLFRETGKLPWIRDFYLKEKFQECYPGDIGLIVITSHDDDEIVLWGTSTD